MKVTRIFCTALVMSYGALAMAQDSGGHDMSGHPMELSAAHEHHGSAVAVTFEELTRTAERSRLPGAQLRSTAKFASRKPRVIER
jgi:hypothetical protein